MALMFDSKYRLEEFIVSTVHQGTLLLNGGLTIELKQEGHDMEFQKQFFDLVEADLCHGRNSIVVRPGPSLFCQTCQTAPIPDLYKYICEVGNGIDHFLSCKLAQAYYGWTKDENTPVSFTVIHGYGILSKRVERQLLSRLRETVHLMRAVNAPFVIDAPKWEMTDDMKDFLSKYVKVITSQRHKQGISQQEQTVLNNILENMHQFLHSKDTPNPFEYYFERLVPYVKSCDKSGPVLELDVEEPLLAKDLLLQFERSVKIRGHYSKYSIPFDVIHVMLGCYVTSVDLHMVANWALDLMARVCRGMFFWKSYADCEFVKRLQAFFKNEISIRKKPQLYYVYREIKKGNAAECLSSFLPKYAQLEKLVKDSFTIGGKHEQVRQVVVNNLFPAILFGDNGDHLGFTMALSHVVANLDPRTGTVKKGTYATARKIHAIVQKYVYSICKFDGIQNLWTIDTLHQFLESEPSLEEDLVEVSKLLLMKQEDDEASENLVEMES